MKRPEKTLTLALWNDVWSGGNTPDTAVLDAAKALRPVIDSQPIREAFAKTERGDLLYTRLRHLLLVVSKSHLILPPEPRRLTWRERFTGRAQA